MKSITYPIHQVFFIAYSGDIYAFGEVLPDQCMGTGLDILETFTDYSEYVKSCYARGINIPVIGNEARQ